MRFRHSLGGEVFAAVGLLLVYVCTPACGSDNNSSNGGTGGQPAGGAGGAGGVTTGTGGMVSAGGMVGSGGMSMVGTGGTTVSTGGAPAGGAGGASGGGGTTGMFPPPKLPTPMSYIAGGNFAPLSAYASRTALKGHAQMIRDAAGKTTVQVHVEGLDPSVMYAAHVHAMPCAVDTGGGHYKIDPTMDMTDPNNEIHLPFMTDAMGIGRTSMTANHFARPDAQSVVVHDPSSMPANAKMACADLAPEPVPTVTSTGTFAPFASASMKDGQIAGTATLVRSATGTTVSVAPTGLDAASMYMAHVHAYPCAVNNAGGHYKLDPTNTMTVESNELWPSLMMGAPALMSPQVARADAESLVIHRVDPAAMAPPKVACADLVRMEAYPPLKTEGTAKLTSAGMSKYASLTAMGSMTRTLPTTTVATVTVSGLGKSAMYGIHVHEYSCSNASGGGHYKIDTTVTTAMESNEIWLSLMTDDTGAGTKTTTITTHLARPEAASIVIHDNDAPTNTRLACIDLL